MINENMLARTDSINQILSRRNAPFRVRYQSVFKTDHTRNAYVLRSLITNIAPIVYYSPDWYNQTDTDVATYLETCFSNLSCMEMDVEQCLEPSFIRSHIYPRVINESRIRDAGSNGITYIPYLDMMIMFVVEATPDSSIILSDSILSLSGINKDVLLPWSLENLRNDWIMMPIGDMMSMIMGYPVSDADATGYPLYVVTRSGNAFGASLIADNNILTEIADRIQADDLVILPSSVHELLILPSSQLWDLPELLRMVSDINASVVAPEERLTDSVYTWSLTTRTVKKDC